MTSTPSFSASAAPPVTATGARCRFRLAPLALLASMALPTASHAAGYYFTDAGTKALGRGTAFVAGVDDLSAQYYNPAALSRLDRGQLYLSLSAVDQYVYFNREDEPENDLTFDPVYNEGPLMLIPAIGVASSFGLPNTTFALGQYSPFAPDLDYDPDGAQRYTLIDSLIWQFALGASVGHHFHNPTDARWLDWLDWLHLGTGFQWWMLRVEQELALTAVEGDDPAYDIDVAFGAWDRFQPSMNFGMLLDNGGWLAFGASAQPPIRYEGHGFVTTDFSGHVWESYLDGTTFTDEDIRLLITVPMILRGGLLLRPTEKLEIEVAGVAEFWSILEEVVITDLDLVIAMDPDSSPFGEDAVVTNDVELLAGYQDTWSLRLGTEYDFTPTVTGRMGGFYELSAVPETTQGVGLVDGDKFGASAGASLNFGDFTFDLALARAWLADRQITDSELTQLVLEIDIADPGASEVVESDKVFGNGHFTSYLTFASVAATWRFGKESTPPPESALTQNFP